MIIIMSCEYGLNGDDDDIHAIIIAQNIKRSHVSIKSICETNINANLKNMITRANEKNTRVFIVLSCFFLLIISHLTSNIRSKNQLNVIKISSRKLM